METRQYVRPTNIYDIRNINTNFNPCRQRSLSRAQSQVLKVAELVGIGDLTAIAAASSATGEVDGCEIGEGCFEPAYQDRGPWGMDSRMAEERDARTVRITCKRGRKAAWLEVTYDDVAEAQAVIAAANMTASKWNAWVTAQ